MLTYLSHNLPLIVVTAWVAGGLGYFLGAAFALGARADREGHRLCAAIARAALSPKQEDSR